MRISDWSSDVCSSDLSLDSVDDYVAGRTYFGAVAGRFANRIAGGRFVLDGTSYQLPCNETGRTHLHGGLRGFSHRNWQVRSVEIGRASCRERVWQYV